MPKLNLKLILFRMVFLPDDAQGLSQIRVCAQPRHALPFRVPGQTRQGTPHLKRARRTTPAAGPKRQRVRPLLL